MIYYWNADLPVGLKKTRRTKPKSMATDEDDGPMRPKKVKSERSRKPIRAVVNEQPEMMAMAAEEDTIKDMDLFFPVLYDAVSNFFNTFTSNKPATLKPTTMPLQMTTTTMVATTTTHAPSQPPNNPQLQKFVPFFFPNLKLNPMQQALANQIVASIAHYG